ncbi:twin-arginine translocase subunit TatC [Desulfovibrio subterraneus]
MTLVQHLDELRKRLKYIALAAIVGCLACYGFAEELFNLLVAPMVRFMPEQSSFIFTAPQEAFLTYLKVAALAGIFLTSPYIFYQVWAFIAPGLYEEERKYIVPVAVFSALFFVGGASFGYFVVFPAAFEFFMSFNNEHIQAMLKLDEYLSFSIKLLLAFGFVFEMPLFALVLSRIGILTADMMRKVRRFAVLGAFVVGAILTPPDVFSQLLMAGPLLVLYEVSIIVASVFGRKKEEPSEEDEAEEDEDDEEAAEAK